MDILHECCAGLDVHKKTIMVCVRRETRAGNLNIPNFLDEFSTGNGSS
jgi:hypothetical protein